MFFHIFRKIDSFHFSSFLSWAGLFKIFLPLCEFYYLCWIFFSLCIGMGSYVAPRKRKMETMIPKVMEEQEDITEEVETEVKKAKTEA